MMDNIDNIDNIYRLTMIEKKISDHINTMNYLKNEIMTTNSKIDAKLKINIILKTINFLKSNLNKISDFNNISSEFSNYSSDLESENYNNSNSDNSDNSNNSNKSDSNNETIYSNTESEYDFDETAENLKYIKDCKMVELTTELKQTKISMLKIIKIRLN